MRTPDEHALCPGFVTVAVGKGAKMAGRKGPVVWLRHGHGRAHRRGMFAVSGFQEEWFSEVFAFGAVGLALDLEDDGSLDQAVEKGHGERPVR